MTQQLLSYVKPHFLSYAYTDLAGKLASGLDSATRSPRPLSEERGAFRHHLGLAGRRHGLLKTIRHVSPEAALAYAGRREQFGRPIAGFQLTQNKLVDMYSELTKARLLALRLGISSLVEGTGPAAPLRDISGQAK